MSLLDTLKQELVKQKQAIISKGGVVTTAGANPTPTEITDGINTFDGNVDSIAAIMGDDTKTLNEGLVSLSGKFRQYAFNHVAQLTGHINIKEGVTEIPKYCFSYTGISSYTLPSTCLKLYSYSFGYNTSLTSIVIPDTVLSMESNVFFGCKNVESISIGSGITEFAVSTIDNANKITELTFPSNIAKIGGGNFKEVKLLTNIYIKNDAVNLISSNIFNTVNDDLLVWINYSGWEYYYSATNWVKLKSRFISKTLGTRNYYLPTIDGVEMSWYATVEDAKARTNPIEVATDNVVYYCRYNVT